MSAATSSGKVLIVDDETDILEIFRRGLEIRGYHVDTYSNPEEALENYVHNHYDHVFLDIRMPVMNGFDLARAMWQKDPSARVCFLTAFESYEEEANKVFKDFNKRCFRKKPVTIQTLVNHIENHHFNK